MLFQGNAKKKLLSLNWTNTRKNVSFGNTFLFYVNLQEKMLVCVRCPSYQCKSFSCCKLIQLVILMTITVLFGLATVALALPFFSSGLPNKSLRLLLKNSQKPSDPHLVIVTGAANSVHFYVLNRNKTRFSLSPNQMISLILMSIFPNPSDREI